MNDRLSRGVISARLRDAIAFALLACAACYCAPSAFSAQPVKRNAPAKTQAASDKTAEKSAKPSAKPNVAPKQGKRRPQEANDGSLPDSETAEFEWTEEANDPGNWLDPDKTKELREQVLAEAKRWRAEWPEFPTIDQTQVKALGIRTIEAGHVAFYTDLPSSKDVDEIPEALDAALPEICNFFHIDASRFDDWKVDAFLMGDDSHFAAIGAIKGRPAFLYGYSMGDRIFAKDQKLAYYNRFLLTHELVHTIMHEVFGDLRPRWYSEGAAEYVGLHQWDPKHKLMTLAQIPESEEATPGFGRLRQIREIVKTEKAPTLFRILNFQPRDFVDVSTYSWSWAFVMFLYNSPKYKDIAEVLPYWSIADDPNKLFVEAIGDRWNELENDWAAYIDQIDYGYDFTAESIDASSNAEAHGELDSGVSISVDPTRGWQNTGVRLESGSTYAIAASGRFDYYLASAKRALKFEASGASLEYFNGSPVGRLQAVVSPDAEEKTFADVYGVDPSASQTNGEDNFRFNAFKGGAAASRNRFGRNVTGFEESDAEAEEASEEASGETPKSGAATARKTRKPAASRDSARYNALYPWNERVELSGTSTSISPKKPGFLYLRINGVPRDLARNKGSVEVRVKKIAAKEETKEDLNEETEAGNE